MFRIRRLHDAVSVQNKNSLEQVKRLLKARIPTIPEEKLNSLSDQLKNPLRYKFRSIIIICENHRGDVRGAAWFSHVPDLEFCYLDYLASTSRETGGGIGGLLYERVREEAAELGSRGLFFEVLADNPQEAQSEQKKKENAARIRFYERFGARVIENTAYETPVDEDDENRYHLMYDDLGTGKALPAKAASETAGAILKRKYGKICPASYIRLVVSSFKDDPVVLRKPKQVVKQIYELPVLNKNREPIVLFVAPEHEQHHIREPGYVESPVRIKTILRELEKTGLFKWEEVVPFPESDQLIRKIHDGEFLRYLSRVCETIPPDKRIYPYVFPLRNRSKPPKMMDVRAGYFCIDTFTPLTNRSWDAAHSALNVVLNGAEALLDGRNLVYALVRPPGHHAGPSNFGGFCYLNSAAAAAEFLSRYGKTAILDVDYHHGNGQQDIFYNREDVLTVSIHCEPDKAYPYFSGYKDERGEGRGKGFNLNIPLPPGTGGEAYLAALEKALAKIKRYKPQYLIVCLGLDTAKTDPTGRFLLKSEDFERNGRLLGQTRLPVLAVQEGGYDNRVLGINAAKFFQGLSAGRFQENAVTPGTMTRSS